MRLWMMLLNIGLFHNNRKDIGQILAVMAIVYTWCVKLFSIFEW